MYAVVHPDACAERTTEPGGRGSLFWSRGRSVVRTFIRNEVRPIARQ
jgi:hypothetical protein